MKHRILTTLILAIMMISSTFATEIKDDVSEKALSTFNEKFNDATKVRWTKSEGFYKAMFTWNDQPMFAYISESGELLGVARNIVYNQLPINLQTSLQKNLTNAWISELYEFSLEGETHYFIKLEDADQSITFKSFGSSWSTYKKIKK